MAELLKLDPSQMAIASPTFTDAAGSPVDTTGYVTKLDSSDESIVKWEKRNDAGEVDENGKDAVVAQGAIGLATVHFTVVNPDLSEAMLTGEVEVVAEGAFAGKMNFGSVMEKK